MTIGTQWYGSDRVLEYGHTRIWECLLREYESHWGTRGYTQLSGEIYTDRYWDQYITGL